LTGLGVGGGCAGSRRRIREVPVVWEDDRYCSDCRAACCGLVAGCALEETLLWWQGQPRESALHHHGNAARHSAAQDQRLAQPPLCNSHRASFDLSEDHLRITLVAWSGTGRKSGVRGAAALTVRAISTSGVLHKPIVITTLPHRESFRIFGVRSHAFARPVVSVGP
jgi:hypothetical protein